MSKKARKIHYLDYGILIPYLLLSLLGVVMSYSASAYRLQYLMPVPAPPESDAIKQAMFLLVSLIGIAFIYKMKTEVFQRKKFIMTAIAVISLLLVYTKLFADPIQGAQGWIVIPGLGTIQPAEFLKIMIIWYLSYIFARRQTGIVTDFKEATLKPLALVGALIFLVLIQPDTGGAVILTLIALVLVLVSGLSYWYAIVIGGTGVALGTLGIKLLSLIPSGVYPKKFQHIYARFASFENPFDFPLKEGHQMINSYYAIYNGGWWGRGLGQSIQKKGFLQEAHSDFMFAIVLEELGLVVGILILMILMFLILRIILVGVKATTSFNSMMCIGIGGMLLIQVFINLGGVLGIIPLTGVTFPFVSQGGSSLITLSVGIGFVLNIRADELRKQHHQQARLAAEVIQMPVK